MNSKWLKDYFYFSRKERRALLALIALIVLFAFIPRIFPYWVKPRKMPSDPAFQQQMEAMMRTPSTQLANESGRFAVAPEPGEKPEYTRRSLALRPVLFDPNTISGEGLAQMGVREKLVRTIVNYRNKGGRFRKPEDLQRIYGMDAGTYAALAPFVRIANTVAVSQAVIDDRPSEVHKTTAHSARKLAVFKLDVNTADTTEWKRLPGIGSKLAARIVNFREKLGGFVSIEQVGETFALPDSTFRRIIPNLQLSTSVIRSIDVNHATEQQLSQHPYISYRLAKAIIAYRQQHGDFSRPEDLRRLMLLSDSVYQKLLPYIGVQ